MQADALNLLVLPLVARIALAYLAMALLKLTLDAIDSAWHRREAPARVARVVFPRGLTRREDVEPRPPAPAEAAVTRRGTGRAL